MRWFCFADDKPEPKDLRSNPPTKVKLPPINKPSPPPVKDKPNKVLPKWVLQKRLWCSLSLLVTPCETTFWRPDQNSYSYAAFLKQIGPQKMSGTLSPLWSGTNSGAFRCSRFLVVTTSCYGFLKEECQDAWHLVAQWKLWDESDQAETDESSPFPVSWAITHKQPYTHKIEKTKTGPSWEENTLLKSVSVQICLFQLL